MKPSIPEGRETVHQHADPVENLLNDARQALEAGNREAAYRLSLEVTKQNQDDEEAWMIRARTAASSEERLLCLSRAIRIDPRDPSVKQVLYDALKTALEMDPFLAYMNENGELYFVRNEEYESLAVPKDRSIPEIYPPQRPEALSKAYRRLGWAVLGLALAGLGTLVFAPLALRMAVTTLHQPVDKPDRVRARLVIWLSILLFAVSLSLGWLVVIHFLG